MCCVQGENNLMGKRFAEKFQLNSHYVVFFMIFCEIHFGGAQHDGVIFGKNHSSKPFPFMLLSPRLNERKFSFSGRKGIFL